MAVALLAALAAVGYVHVKKPTASTPEAGKENVSTDSVSPAWYPSFMAFKEIRAEMSPETPTVGQLVEYRIHLVPVDDLNAVSHPWIDSMRSRVAVDTVTGRVFPQQKQFPNFSISGLTYQIWYFLHGNFDDRGRTLGLVGNEFVSVTSRVRQNTVWVNRPSENPQLAIGGYIDNLILDNQSDTVTLTMRFANLGKYSLITDIQFALAPYGHWQGQGHIELYGERGNVHTPMSELERHFIVEER